MLIHAELLRTHGSVYSKFVQDAVHIGLFAPAARPTGQGASQVLAAVRIQVAQKNAKCNRISDTGSPLSVRHDVHDG
jgi:hypothetical protein